VYDKGELQAKLDKIADLMDDIATSQEWNLLENRPV
jgi:hypothetical protein